MKPLLAEEFKPLSEFPENVASFLAQRTGSKAHVYSDKPAHGAVILDLVSYQALKDELSLLRDIHQASQEIAAGEGVPHDLAREQILSRLDQ